MSPEPDAKVWSYVGPKNCKIDIRCTAKGMDNLRERDELFSAYTIQEEIKSVVQEEMDDKDCSAELIGRLMDRFSESDSIDGDSSDR